MFVNLKRAWFDPSGSLRETRFNPHEMPDTWKDILPPGAEVVDEKGKVLARGDDLADPKRQVEESLKANPATSTMDPKDIKAEAKSQVEDKQAAASAAPATSTVGEVEATTKSAQDAKAKDPTTESNKK